MNLESIQTTSREQTNKKYDQVVKVESTPQPKKAALSSRVFIQAASPCEIGLTDPPVYCRKLVYDIVRFEFKGRVLMSSYLELLEPRN
ncbi:hypothetical protein TNCV_2232461 [Trichonephila clavipes]|nr:hypothetical protein TNCV_2232461 [Trichonephila clavipes]